VFAVPCDDFSIEFVTAQNEFRNLLDPRFAPFEGKALVAPNSPNISGSVVKGAQFVEQQ
jgi:hypothetical protein